MEGERYNVVGKIYAGGWNFVPQAISGERTPVACWLWHSAATNFPCYQLNSLWAQQYKSSRWQNAIASTLQACAPRRRSRSGRKHD